MSGAPNPSLTPSVQCSQQTLPAERQQCLNSSSGYFYLGICLCAGPRELGWRANISSNFRRWEVTKRTSVPLALCPYFVRVCLRGWLSGIEMLPGAKLNFLSCHPPPLPPLHSLFFSPLLPSTPCKECKITFALFFSSSLSSSSAYLPSTSAALWLAFTSLHSVPPSVFRLVLSLCTSELILNFEPAHRSPCMRVRKLCAFERQGFGWERHVSSKTCVSVGTHCSKQFSFFKRKRWILVWSAQFEYFS